MKCYNQKWVKIKSQCLKAPSDKRLIFQFQSKRDHGSFYLNCSSTKFLSAFCNKKKIYIYKIILPQICDQMNRYPDEIIFALFKHLPTLRRIILLILPPILHICHGMLKFASFIIELHNLFEQIFVQFMPQIIDLFILRFLLCHQVSAILFHLFRDDVPQPLKPEGVEFLLLFILVLQ